MPNSINAAPQPKKTDAEQSANYFNDFSQFGGEWQEPTSRSTNKERGAKVAKSAGFTFSYGEMPMDNHSYTVTETWNSIRTSPDTTKQFDLIFADPPYDLEGLDTLPDRIFGLNANNASTEEENYPEAEKDITAENIFEENSKNDYNTENARWKFGKA